MQRLMGTTDSIRCLPIRSRHSVTKVVQQQHQWPLENPWTNLDASTSNTYKWVFTCYMHSEDIGTCHRDLGTC